MPNPLQPKPANVLIYDDFCPLCSLYTRGFVGGGMIDGRVCFSSIPAEYRALIDLDRARHEIPYLDLARGRVFYGIEALAEVLSKRMPWLKPLILWGPVFLFLRLLYKFISFNRHVIIPNLRWGAVFDCTPDFNLFWRSCYIVWAFGMSLLFTALFIRRHEGYVSTETMLLSGCIAGGKWALQILLAWTLLGNRRWLYIGQLATTCLLGSLTLLPFALLSGSGTFFLGSLLVCIVVMGADTFCRHRRIGLGWPWTALWMGLLCVAVALQLTVVFHLC